jgi:hypothetical protein
MIRQRLPGLANARFRAPPSPTSEKTTRKTLDHDLREEKSTQANNPSTPHDPTQISQRCLQADRLCRAPWAFTGHRYVPICWVFRQRLTGSTDRRRIPRAYIWSFCVYRKRSEACEKPAFAFPVRAFTDYFPQETYNSGQSKDGQGGQQGGSGQQGNTGGG